MNIFRRHIAAFARKLFAYRYVLQGVKVGKNVYISLGAKIDTTYPDSIIIEDGVYVTFGVIILAHDHSVYRVVGKEFDNGRGLTVISRNAFLGAGSIILRNVKIGENSVVAAGSVVTKDVPSNCVVAGNPAVVIKYFIAK